MKRKKQNKLSILVLILGILVMCYPAIAKILDKMNQSNVIAKYSEQIEEMKEEDIENQKQQYEKYNNEIISEKMSSIDLLQSGQILGHIGIERINTFLPIYEGTDSKTLQKGIGHLEKTTLPTKNLSYHAVFVGHTGITSKKLFDDLDKLKKGDRFTITILDERFEYKVYDIKVVKPSDTSSIKVQNNKQLVTLVTCTPKFVNSHRLLVMGEIID